MVVRSLDVADEQHKNCFLDTVFRFFLLFLFFATFSFFLCCVYSLLFFVFFPICTFFLCCTATFYLFLIAVLVALFDVEQGVVVGGEK